MAHFPSRTICCTLAFGAVHIANIVIKYVLDIINSVLELRMLTGNYLICLRNFKDSAAAFAVGNLKRFNVLGTCRKFDRAAICWAIDTPDPDIIRTTVGDNGSAC